MSSNDDESIGEIQGISAGEEREGKMVAATRLSIKEARVMADDTQLENAKDIIVKAQNSLDDKDKVDELNKMKSDLKRLLTLMKTQGTYEKQGRDFALTLETSHDPDNLAARGNEGPSSGTGKTTMKIITKREAPLEQSKFNVKLELTSNETPGLDLVTVLDISGSMRGEKLEKMKSAMQLVIKKLSPIDRLSVVTFSSHSKTLCPLSHMTENSKAKIERQVNKLVAGGGTNISAGIKNGLQNLKDCSPTSRRWVAIMLLCDGEQGPRDPDAVEVEIGNVPVYTFGLGSYYDPKVLKAIAKKSSGGMFTDVKNVDKLSEAFSQCLDGLLLLVVKDLKVTITQENNTEIEKVSAENYSQYRNNNGSVTVSLDDVYEKERRKVTVDLLLPASSSTDCVKVLNISYTYRFRGEPISTNPLPVTITRRNSTPMINEARVVKDKQLKVANKMIIEAQKLLKSAGDETTLKSEVQLLKRLMNSQKIYNQRESEEVTIEETTSLAPIGQASAGQSNNEVEDPIEFVLDRTVIRNKIRNSLNRSADYEDWRDKVKAYLEKLEVWKVIEPPIETTESMENDDEIWLSTRKAIQVLRQFRENWMALIVINEACGIPIKLQIIDLHCARTAWKTLATNSTQGVNVEELFEAVQHCDWKKVEDLLDGNPTLPSKLAEVRIPSSQNTVLHLASLAGEVTIVKKLVERMVNRTEQKKYLEMKGNDDYTALANASINGETRIAKFMVGINKELVSIPTASKLLPVVIAVMNGHKQMTRYLYEVTPKEDLTNNDDKGNINGATLLTYSIRMQLYDISFDLIQKCNSLIFASDKYGQSALYQLACTPNAFRSSSKLKFWKRLLYNCVPAQDINRDNNNTMGSVRHEGISQSNGDNRDTSQSVQDENGSQSNCWNAANRGVPAEDINRYNNNTVGSVRHEGVSQSNGDNSDTSLSDQDENGSQCNCWNAANQGVPAKDINRDNHNTMGSVRAEGVCQSNGDNSDTSLSVQDENGCQSNCWNVAIRGVLAKYINRDNNNTMGSVRHVGISQSNGDNSVISLSVHDENGSQSNCWKAVNRGVPAQDINWDNNNTMGSVRHEGVTQSNGDNCDSSLSVQNENGSQSNCWNAANRGVPAQDINQENNNTVGSVRHEGVSQSNGDKSYTSLSVQDENGRQSNCWNAVNRGLLAQDINRDNINTMIIVRHEGVSQSNGDNNDTSLSVQDENCSQSNCWNAANRGVPAQDINQDNNNTVGSVRHKGVSQSNGYNSDSSLSVQDENGSQSNGYNSDSSLSVQDENGSQSNCWNAVNRGVPTKDINRDNNNFVGSVRHEGINQSNGDNSDTSFCVQDENDSQSNCWNAADRGVPAHDMNGDNNTMGSVLHNGVSQSNGEISDTRISVQNEDGSQSYCSNAGNRGVRQRIVAGLRTVSGIKGIYEMKLVHRQSLRLLDLICEQIKDDLDDDVINGIINALHEAAAKGVEELIENVLKKLPELRLFRDKQGSTIFMKAVEFRQERVFSLLQEFAYKDKMIDWFDDRGENILHKLKYNSVDKISNIQGAVFKMQKELQWHEEIKPMMSRDSTEKQNSEKNTPPQLFRESHRELMKNAEKWLYKTANSCIIVGVLVVTIMFAAAFTVPGGNDQTTGSPLFMRKKWFKIFIISDAVSLFSSTTSVLIFLGILSSRYAERDFLESLPKKMIFGLFTLFLSIATMMFAFGATLFMMLHAESRIILPAVLSSLGVFPLWLYVGFLFPLLFEFTMSTYGPSIFNKKSKWWFFSFYLNKEVKWWLIG